MFSETAQLYDLVYSGKDYGGEAAYVRGLVNAARRAGAHPSALDASLEAAYA